MGERERRCVPLCKWGRFIFPLLLSKVGGRMSVLLTAPFAVRKRIQDIDASEELPHDQIMQSNLWCGSKEFVYYLDIRRANSLATQTTTNTWLVLQASMTIVPRLSTCENLKSLGNKKTTVANPLLVWIPSVLAQHSNNQVRSTAHLVSVGWGCS